MGDVGLIVGFVGDNPVRPGRPITNAAALLHRGQVVAIRTKTLLPTYDVFDEDRYFEPASENAVVHWEGRRLGLTICEDIWNDAEFGVQRRYRPDPAAALVASGAEILINLSASPWQLGKEQRRCGLLRSLARRHQVPVVYCNLVGGNDELVFDGRSLAFNAEGGCMAEANHFRRILWWSTRMLLSIGHWLPSLMRRCCTMHWCWVLAIMSENAVSNRW